MIHHNPAFALVNDGLPGDLRRQTSTVVADQPEQIAAWFDAANRERPAIGAPTLLHGLLELMVKHTKTNSRALRTHLFTLRLQQPDDLRDVSDDDDLRDLSDDLQEALEGALEQIIERHGIAVSAADFLDTQQVCLPRVALMRVGGCDAGTGFLVGDDLLLTAYHVVSNVVAGSSDPASVEVVFDFRRRKERASLGPSVGLYLDADPEGKQGVTDLALGCAARDGRRA